MWTMLRVGGLLSSLVVLAVMAAPAGAAPPAPGAPGAVHTWAPADKHGFGTAHQLAGHAYFTLRQALAERGLLPGPLARPAFRGLQFAVTDGKTFVDRETSTTTRATSSRVAPGVTATRRRRSTARSRFRQVTENARWRLTKTWITDPARATACSRACASSP